jgi:hypothetical protein
VFGNTGGLSVGVRVRRALRVVEAHRGDTAAALREVSTSRRQLRDRALLLIGYGAALWPAEATSLLACHIEVAPDGLLLAVPNRRFVTAIPGDPGMPYDATAAWEEWVSGAAPAGLPAAWPAFPHIPRNSIWNEPLDTTGLSYTVERAARRAQVESHYTFTSLRVGWIRTALRADAQSHDIAAHVDLRRLESVTLHDYRENLIRHSVAGQLGL